jgi:diguanylate cyclase (GGDEF)-like protein
MDDGQMDGTRIDREVRSLGELAIGVLSLDGRWVRVDDRLSVAVGRDQEWLLANPATAAMHPEDRAGAQATLSMVLQGVVDDRSWELRWVAGDGTVRRGRVTVALVRDGQGVPSHAVVVLENLDRRVRVVTELVDAACRDDLTGLLNRAGVYAEVRSWLEQHRAVGVVFCDLDRFKVINDALGHQVGDELLSAVAGRLAGAAPPGALVARVGGDEFLVVVPDCADDAGLLAAANRLCEVFTDPISCAGHLLTVGVSAGAVLAAPGADVVVAVRDADVAMYVAKRGRGDGAVLYTDAMGAVARRRLQVETALRQALASHRITVVYQPVVHLDTGRWDGVEVLARWTDPDLGVVEPDEFIAIAEDLGLIRQLTQQIVHRAFSDLATWYRAGWADGLRCGVNISAGDLADAGLVSWIVDIARQYGISPAVLALEVTETTLLRAGKDAVAVLRSLDALGSIVTLDDFGTGYSRLGHLRELPVRGVKIDESLVSGPPHTGTTSIAAADGGPGLADAALVTAVVSLAHDLNLRVLIEGVETRAQHHQARVAGCRLGQGYLYARPMTGPDVAEHLLASTPHLPTASRPDDPRSPWGDAAARGTTGAGVRALPPDPVTPPPSPGAP